MDIDGKNGKWNVIPFDLLKLKQIISSWQKAIDWNTLFWGNHDQPRAVSRFGSTETEELRVQSAKMLATAMYLMRGTPFIYQGEEIGMTNYPFVSPDELRDVESINLLHEAEKRQSQHGHGTAFFIRDGTMPEHPSSGIVQTMPVSQREHLGFR